MKHIALIALLTSFAASALAQPPLPPRPAAPPSLDEIRTRIEQLARSPENKERAATFLTRLLDAPREEVQWRAARAISRLEASTPETAGKLQKLVVGSESTAVRLHSIRALAAIDDKSTETVDALMTAIVGDNAQLARVAVQAARDLELPPEKAAKSFAAALASENQAVASYAVEAVVEAGAKSTPFLIEALKNDASTYWAALAIYEIGADAAGTVPALIDAIARDSDPQTQVQICLALAKMGDSALPATQALCNLLMTSEDVSERAAGSYALGAIGAKDCEKALETCANCDDAFVSMVGTWAMAKTTGSEADILKAVDKLVPALTSDDETMRQAAAKGLFELQAPPEITAPRLMAAANSADANDRRNLVGALASLGGDVVPKATLALDKPEQRLLALEVLASVGPEAAPAAAKLIGLIGEVETESKPLVFVALGRIGPAAAAATDDLIAAVASSDEQVRKAALFGLRGIGPAAKKAVPALMAKSSVNDGSLEAFARAWALVSIAGDDADVIAAVAPTLKSGLTGNEVVKLETLTALQGVSDVAKAMQEDIERLAVNDPSDAVRTAALAVLGKL